MTTAGQLENELAPPLALTTVIVAVAVVVVIREKEREPLSGRGGGRRTGALDTSSIKLQEYCSDSEILLPKRLQAACWWTSWCVPDAYVRRHKSCIERIVMQSGDGVGRGLAPSRPKSEINKLT